MKVFGFVIGFAIANPLADYVLQPVRPVGGRPTQTKDDSRDLPGEGKYPMFQRLVKYYNREFHANQHWAYGCNCQMMVDDRSMEKSSFGPPVDELDKTCKKLKDCYKCVKQAYGGKCTPENVEYDIFFRGQEILVGNQPGTCGRAIYECDLQYAKGLSKGMKSFDMRYNFFYGGFDPMSESAVCNMGGQKQENGLSSSNKFGIRDLTPNVQCCGSKKDPIPFNTYNANVKQCCSGVVKDQCS